VLLLSSSSPTLASMIARHPSQEAPRNSLPSSSGSRSASRRVISFLTGCPALPQRSPLVRLTAADAVLAVCLPIVTPRRYPAATYHTSAP
jgi:hypothetical protein